MQIFYIMRYWKPILLIAFSLIAKNANAQYATDNISLEGDVVSWYDQQISLQHTLLQHGELAALTRKSPNSHAYYGKSSWADTRITYRNQTFYNVSALYDLEEDALIIINNLGPAFTAYPLKLQREHIQSFEIEGSRFVYVKDQVSWHKNGFFKAVYEGENLSLLSKVFKRLDLRHRVLTYNESQHYFLKKDGQYHRLKRLSALLRLYPEHKKEIRQYKRALSLGKIDKPANEEKLARLIEYCENLK